MAILRNKCKKLSDERLMERIQRHDTSALDELYERYSKRLLIYFFRELGGDEEKAQDFLQEVFLKIVEKPELFCTGKSFSAWIFVVAYNMCKNEYRRLGVRKTVNSNSEIEKLPQPFENDYRQLERSVDLKAFHSALIKELYELEDDHRSTFLLRYQQNFSIKEIGEILGCPEGTVKSRLHYAAKKLATKLRAFNPYKDEVSKNEGIK
jgi:RNA polymerase sigma-70 factor (ECF subfamily)